MKNDTKAIIILSILLAISVFFNVYSTQRSISVTGEYEKLYSESRQQDIRIGEKSAEITGIYDKLQDTQSALNTVRSERDSYIKQLGDNQKRRVYLTETADQLNSAMERELQSALGIIRGEEE